MFEKEAVEVACPKCGHKSEEIVGRLKTAGYTCSRLWWYSWSGWVCQGYQGGRGRDREVEEALRPREENRWELIGFKERRRIRLDREVVDLGFHELIS